MEATYRNQLIERRDRIERKIARAKAKRAAMPGTNMPGMERLTRRIWKLDMISLSLGNALAGREPIAGGSGF